MAVAAASLALLLLVAFAGTVAGDETPPASMFLTDLVAPEEPDVGKPVVVRATLVNNRTDSATASVALFIDHANAEEQIVAAGPGASVSVEFTVAFPELKPYAVTIGITDGPDGADLVPLPPARVHPRTYAEFALGNVTAPATSTVGQAIAVEGVVTNTGTAAGTATVLLLVDDAVRDSKQVPLGAGSSKPVAFDFTPNRAATLLVNLRLAASPPLTPPLEVVVAPSAPTPEPTPTTTTGPTPTAAPTPTSASPSSPAPAESESKTPAPPVGLLMALVGVAAWTLRRR